MEQELTKVKKELEDEKKVVKRNEDTVTTLTLDLDQERRKVKTLEKKVDVTGSKLQDLTQI